jgi:hypothetical protein
MQATDDLTPTWLAPQRLEPLRHVNEQALALFTDAAAMPDDAAAPIALAPGVREALRRTDRVTRARIARLPCLLVDLQFDDPHVWTRMAPTASRSTKLAGTDARLIARRDELARITLLLAWHITRVDAEAALVLLGMPRSVSEAIAALPVTEIGARGHALAPLLVPRWGSRSAAWRRLLAPLPAQTGDLLACYVLQLLGSSFAARADRRRG